MGVFEQFPYSNFHDLNLDWVLQTVKKVVEQVTELTTALAVYEKSENITINRKLSTNGNFTGTLAGRPGADVLRDIDSNRSTLQYITSQFTDGQTGFVIDGGFFEDDGIKKNYSGGVF